MALHPQFRRVSRLLVWTWPVVPAVGFSAIVHSTDQAASGLAAVLTTDPWRQSVLFWALPLVLVTYLAVAVQRRYGPAGSWSIALGAALLVGIVIAAAGSTATSATGFAWSVTGASGCVLLVIWAGASVPVRCGNESE